MQKHGCPLTKLKSSLADRAFENSNLVTYLEYEEMKFSFNGIGTSSALAAALAAGSMNFNVQNAVADEPVLHNVFVLHDDDDHEHDHEVELKVKVSAPKLWLGIGLKPIEGDLAKYLRTESGILVDSVYPESPAAKAGIEEGDILMSAGESELGQPSDLLEVMTSLDEDKPKVKLTLMRKGEKMNIAVKAAERPEMEEVNDFMRELDIDIEGLGDNAEVKTLLKGLRLGTNGDAVNVFRFGSPAIVLDELDGEQEMDVVVTSDADGEGKKFKIRVQRENDKPAKITVETDGEVKEVTEEELDELPEELREKVTKALGKTSRGFWMADGNVRVVGPNWMDLRLQDLDVEKLNGVTIRKRAREMAEKAREMAEKHSAEAREHASKARAFSFRASADSEEMEELRDLVKQLQKQVEELQEKLEDK